MRRRMRTGIVAAIALLAAGAAASAPIETSTVTFENLDTPPFYFKATLDIEVYAPGDPASPVFSATDFTYVYRLTNFLAPPPSGQFNIPLDTFEVGLGSSAVVSNATSVDDTPGVAPSSIVVSPTKVSFSFASPTIDPGGAPSDRLVIQSSFGPGDVNGTVGLSAFLDDQVVRGPAVLPVATFPCFDINKAEIEIKLDKSGHDEVKIEKGVIDLGPSDSFDLATEAVKLELNGGLLTETIPAGSFEQKGSRLKFKFKTGSGVVPKVHMHLNLEKGEWEVKISKIDASAFAGATQLDVLLMIGDAKGEVSVPLTIEKDTTKERELEFKRSPRTRCVAETPEEEAKRSCLSFLEVTYKLGTTEQEVLRKFSDEIGHPETTFVASDGTSATFHTSCSQCLVCGQTDASGLFAITGISDATGRLGQVCGVPDASCGTPPPSAP